MIRSNIWIGLVAMAFSGALATFSVNASEKLVIGVKADIKPVGYMENGERKGFDIDVAKTIVSRLAKMNGKEIDIEFATVTTQDRFEKIRTKAIDMLVATVSITADRLEQYRFSDPYFYTEVRVISRRDNPISAIEKVQTTRVVTLKNSTTASYLSQIRGVTILLVDNVAQMRDALRKNEVAALAIDSTFMPGILADLGDGFVENAICLGVESYGIVFTDAAKPEFVAQVNNILSSLKNDGTLNALAQHHGLPVIKRLSF